MLCRVARGGQVLLSDAAWSSVKPSLDRHPGAAQAISLGVHVVSEDLPSPMELFEVMPNLLSRRNFKLPATAAALEPGYRDAPAPSDPMALVFVKVIFFGVQEGGCWCCLSLSHLSLKLTPTTTPPKTHPPKTKQGRQAGRRRARRARERRHGRGAGRGGDHGVPGGRVQGGLLGGLGVLSCVCARGALEPSRSKQQTTTHKQKQKPKKRPACRC